MEKTSYRTNLDQYSGRGIRLLGLVVTFISQSWFRFSAIHIIFMGMYVCMLLTVHCVSSVEIKDSEFVVRTVHTDGVHWTKT
jgi:hypothetical protein